MEIPQEFRDKMTPQSVELLSSLRTVDVWAGEEVQTRLNAGEILIAVAVVHDDKKLDGFRCLMGKR